MSGDAGVRDIDDLEPAAKAARLHGLDRGGTAYLTRAYQRHVDRGDHMRAARCGFWLVFGSLSRGEFVAAGGWLARSWRLLDDGRHECVERGYLLLLDAMVAAKAEYSQAFDLASQAAEYGTRFGDADVVALARTLQGHSAIRSPDVVHGLALLDEAMAAVMAGEVSPIVAGTVYCGLIKSCQEVGDMRRVQECTAAMSDWCESQPEVVMYGGQCLLHRAELMQLSGAWKEALAEARRATEQLADATTGPAVGAAYYRQAELHRLLGEFTHAEHAYRQAGERGYDPQPGMALLRLAQARLDLAGAAIQRALNEASGSIARLPLLAVYVEIMLDAGDVEAARVAADELSQIADLIATPFVRATLAQATGAVLLATGDSQAALSPLRQSWTTWQELDVPYEAGRSRSLIGLACRRLGDVDTAGMELDAARSIFQRLGAKTELARIEALTGRAGAHPGLTSREVQVLRLVATGRTNREIAATLVLSRKTVDRHVSNILTKLDLPSRSAATAYAFKNGLVREEDDDLHTTTHCARRPQSG